MATWPWTRQLSSVPQFLLMWNGNDNCYFLGLWGGLKNPLPVKHRWQWGLFNCSHYFCHTLPGYANGWAGHHTSSPPWAFTSPGRGRECPECLWVWGWPWGGGGGLGCGLHRTGSPPPPGQDPARLRKSPPQDSPAIAGRSSMPASSNLCLLEKQGTHI